MSTPGQQPSGCHPLVALCEATERACEADKILSQRYRTDEDHHFARCSLELAAQEARRAATKIRKRLEAGRYKVLAD